MGENHGFWWFSPKLLFFHKIWCHIWIPWQKPHQKHIHFYYRTLELQMLWWKDNRSKVRVTNPYRDFLENSILSNTTVCDAGDGLYTASDFNLALLWQNNVSFMTFLSVYLLLLWFMRTWFMNRTRKRGVTHKYSNRNILSFAIVCVTV